jgi:hypothetical protein
MGRPILVALLAAGIGLFGAHVGALAQQTPQPFAPPLVGAEPEPEAASPNGAVYIPGVGFRYLVPGGARLYGYRAPVYGYRYRAYRRACADRDWWGWDRCGRRWR